MHADNPTLDRFRPYATASSQERLLDRLAEIHLGADEILELLRGGDAVGMQWLESHVRRISDDVHAVMTTLSA